MERAITASDANQRFSEMLRTVQAGETFVWTSRGLPVAKVSPVDDLAEQKRKGKALVDDLATLPITHAEGWRHEALYE